MLLKGIRLALELGVMPQVRNILLLQVAEDRAHHALAGLDAVQPQEAGQRAGDSSWLVHNALRQRDEWRAVARAMTWHEHPGLLVQKIKYGTFRFHHTGRTLGDEAVQGTFRLAALNGISHDLKHIKHAFTSRGTTRVASLKSFIASRSRARLLYSSKNSAPASRSTTATIHAPVMLENRLAQVTASGKEA